MPDSNTTVTWQPKRTVPGMADLALPPLFTLLGRGLMCRCPVCGKGRVFDGYLSVVPACSACAAPLGLARADDAPPYFTLFIMCHVVVLGLITVERAYNPSMGLEVAIWIPVMVIGCLLLLRPIKGATVGLMLKLGLVRDNENAA